MSRKMIITTLVTIFILVIFIAMFVFKKKKDYEDYIKGTPEVNIDSSRIEEVIGPGLYDYIKRLPIDGTLTSVSLVVDYGYYVEVFIEYDNGDSYTVIYDDGSYSYTKSEELEMEEQG